MLWLTNSTVRPSPSHLAHLAQTFLLKRRVADRQDLVHDQNFRLQMRGDGERQSHIHAATVSLDRRVEELLDFGKRHDLVEFALDLRRLMPRIAPLRKMFSRPVSSG